MAHTEQKRNVSILSSKRLTKSFQRVDNHEIWESIGLTPEEAVATVKRAINKMTVTSEPLTITITVNT